METFAKLFGDNTPDETHIPGSEIEAQPEPQIVQPAPVQEEAPQVVESAPAADPIAPQTITPENLGIVLGERDRRKAAEAERDALRAQLAEREARTNAVAPPDPVMDQQGFIAWQQAQLQQSEARVLQRISANWAVKEYGEDLVKKAESWANQNPAVLSEITKSAHPYESAVKQYQRHLDQERLGGQSLDAYIEAEIARRSALPQTPPGPLPQAQRTPLPPRSIAGATAATGPQTVPQPSKIMNKLFVEPI